MKYEYTENLKGDHRFPMTAKGLEALEMLMSIIQVMPVMLLNEEEKTRYLHLLGKNYLCYLGYYNNE